MLDIYYSDVAFDVDIDEISNIERRKIIEETSNPTLKRERYSVWRLLKYAIKNSLNLDIEDLNIFRDKNGKWLSDTFYFSMTHTENLVAVAISDFSVGVDVEKARCVNIESFSKRILTVNEREKVAVSSDKNDLIIKLWTAKEAIYKRKGIPPFLPSKTDAFDYPIHTFEINKHNEKYYLTVCSDEIKSLRIFAI